MFRPCASARTGSPGSNRNAKNVADDHHRDAEQRPAHLRHGVPQEPPTGGLLGNRLRRGWRDGHRATRQKLESFAVVRHGLAAAGEEEPDSGQDDDAGDGTPTITPVFEPLASAAAPSLETASSV